MNTVMANSSNQPLVVHAWPRNHLGGSRRGVENFIFNTVERGHYVVLCESDSYLTDSLAAMLFVYARSHAKPWSSM